MERRVAEAHRIAKEEAERLESENRAKVLPFRLAAAIAVKRAVAAGPYLPVGQYDYLPPEVPDEVDEAFIESHTVSARDPEGRYYWKRVSSAVW